MCQTLYSHFVVLATFFLIFFFFFLFCDSAKTMCIKFSFWGITLSQWVFGNKDLDISTRPKRGSYSVFLFFNVSGIAYWLLVATCGSVLNS